MTIDSASPMTANWNIAWSNAHAVSPELQPITCGSAVAVADRSGRAFSSPPALRRGKRNPLRNRSSHHGPPIRRRNRNPPDQNAHLHGRSCPTTRRSSRTHCGYARPFWCPDWSAGGRPASRWDAAIGSVANAPLVRSTSTRSRESCEGIAAGRRHRQMPRRNGLGGTTESAASFSRASTASNDPSAIAVGGRTASTAPPTCSVVRTITRQRGQFARWVAMATCWPRSRTPAANSVNSPSEG